MTPDDRSPDPPPPSLALALGLLAAVVVIAACDSLDRARRMWRRLRWAVGDALIVAGARMAPPLPPELDTPEANARRRARITAAVMAAVAAERRRGRGAERVNGRCNGRKGPAIDGPI